MKKKILILFNQRQDATITEVTLNLGEWMAYYANHETLEVDFKQEGLWCDIFYNKAILLAIEKGYDYIFQFDCDMTGDPKLLEALVKANKECVGMLFFHRQSPHKPQLWFADIAKNGDLTMFYELSNPKFVRDSILEKALIKTDARATGFTLFKTESLKEIGFPYAESRPSRNLKNVWDGWDMVICSKFTEKFGGVWTLCDPSYDVKHWQYIGITEKDYFNGN